MPQFWKNDKKQLDAIEAIRYIPSAVYNGIPVWPISRGTFYAHLPQIKTAKQGPGCIS